jgi:hypothetical protein
MSHLPVLDAHAACVDVGSEHMHVSFAGGLPQVFGTVLCNCTRCATGFLERDAVGGHGSQQGVLGVYWLPPYGVLEAAGPEFRMPDIGNGSIASRVKTLVTAV